MVSKDCCAGRLPGILRESIFHYPLCDSNIPQFYHHLPNMAAKLNHSRAIVSHSPVDGKRQWILEKVALGQPRETEALVEMVASGLCHTDLGCGTDPDGTPGFPVPPYPRVLGHEGGLPSRMTQGGSFTDVMQVPVT